MRRPPALRALRALSIAPAALAAALCAAPAAGQHVPAQPAQPELSHRANKSPEARNTDPEGADPTAKGTPMGLGKADRAFVTQAAAGGLFEMQAAKLAGSHAQDARVKALAEALLRDHANASKGLRAVSLEHNYPLPDRPAADKQALIDQLATRHGAAFDAMFVQEVGIAAHEDDIRAFKRAARATRTPDLKEWVDRTLPVLESHLRQARAITER